MAFVWPLISKAMKQTANSGLLAICTQYLNQIGQEMAEIPLMATLAFVVWPLIFMAMNQTSTTPFIVLDFWVNVHMFNVTEPFLCRNRQECVKS